MNKYFLVFFTIIIIFVVFLSIYLYQNRKPLEYDENAPIDINSDISHDETELSDFAEYLEKKKEFKELNKDQLEKESKAYWNRMVKLAEGRKEEIRFFGKIVDQFDNPVVGAQVLFSAKSGYLVEGDGRSMVETDSSGIFEIKNVSGVGLHIIRILKPGYQIDVGGFGAGGTSFSNYKRFESSKLWSEHNTRDKAMVYRSWKIHGGYPNTSYIRHGGYLDFGRTYSYDFSSKKNKVIKDGSTQDWDFQITFDRTEFDWKLLFVVPNGGVIEQDDSLNLFEAPQLGNYQSVFEVSAPRGGHEVVKSFYIYTRGLYGKMRLSISPNRSTRGFIRFEAVVNLDKERNLIRPQN